MGTGRVASAGGAPAIAAIGTNVAGPVPAPNDAGTSGRAAGAAGLCRSTPSDHGSGEVALLVTATPEPGLGGLARVSASDCAQALANLGQGLGKAGLLCPRHEVVIGEPLKSLSNLVDSIGKLNESRLVKGRLVEEMIVALTELAILRSQGCDVLTERLAV